MTPRFKPLQNPFVLTGFYHKNYFCDREEEFLVLQNHIQNERNVVLYAWRRMGKTALIKYFLAFAEENLETDTLYVDLMATRNISAAVNLITQAVYEKYGRAESGFSAAIMQLFGKIGVAFSIDAVTGMPKAKINFTKGEMPERTLEEIANFLLERKKRVIIAIDEFQQVTHYADENAEAVFRAWTQQFPSIRFIFSGSHRHMMASMFSEKNRPFYRSAQLLELGPIELGAYSTFIKMHFTEAGKTIDDAQIENMYSWCRKQTYAMQVLCNKVYGRAEIVDDEVIEAVKSESLAQESPIFNNYAQLLTNAQWSTLVAIAKEEPLTNPLAKEFLEKHKLGAASTVNTALKKLTDTEIVVKEETTYIVQDVLLARWLTQQG